MLEEDKIFTTPNSIGLFMRNMNKEIAFAQDKFPKNKNLLGALMEEVGELAQALLKITESGESSENVYKEAIQVATVAYRIASEGCPEYEYRGTKCSYAGCASPTIGGPCVICYD